MNKYRAQKQGGYHSKREHKRALELKELESSGLISNLREQVPFELVPSYPKQQRAINYIADFTYVEDGETIVEDVKGFRTPLYKIKKKLLWHVHRIKIKET